MPSFRVKLKISTIAFVDVILENLRTLGNFVQSLPRTLPAVLMELMMANVVFEERGIRAAESAVDVEGADDVGVFAMMRAEDFKKNLQSAAPLGFLRKLSRMYWQKNAVM
jgi:hypothetical protein